MKYSRVLRNYLPFLVLAATCSTTMASGLERRNRNTVRQPERALDVNNDEIKRGLRVASAKTNKDEDRKLQKRSVGHHRTRTRGAQMNLQSRRQLGKDGGKNGGKDGGKNGGKNGGSGSGSSGYSTYDGASVYSYQDESNRTGPGYTEDGVYIGCLDHVYESIGFDTKGLTCDYAVEENSYGYNVTDPEPDNSDWVPKDYFKYSQLSSWQKTSDYFHTSYYTNQETDEYEARNVDDAQYDEEEGDDSSASEAVFVYTQSDDYDPYAAFDVGKCDTYSHLWTFDLLLSCEQGEQYCKCKYTEELMSQGLLSCDDISSCPSECGVCASCLNSICHPPLPTSIVAYGFRANPGLSLAAVVSTVLLAGYVFQRRKNGGKGLLNEKLMDANGIPYKKRDWKVTLDKYGQPTEVKSWRKKKTKVWLAPDVSTVPAKPLFPDVLEKGQAVELAASKKEKKKRGQPMIVTDSNISVDSSLSSNVAAGYTAPVRVAEYKEFEDNDSTADYIESRIRSSY